MPIQYDIETGGWIYAHCHCCLYYIVFGWLARSPTDRFKLGTADAPNCDFTP
jgi:hypothetical protein